VLRLVIAEGMKPILLGIGLGAFEASTLGGVLSKLICGVRATDPLTFFVVAVLVIMVVAWLPARFPLTAQTRVQPVQALRGE